MNKDEKLLFDKISTTEFIRSIINDENPVIQQTLAEKGDDSLINSAFYRVKNFDNLSDYEKSLDSFINSNRSILEEHKDEFKEYIKLSNVVTDNNTLNKTRKSLQQKNEVFKKTGKSIKYTVEEEIVRRWDSGAKNSFKKATNLPKFSRLSTTKEFPKKLNPSNRPIVTMGNISTGRPVVNFPKKGVSVEPDIQIGSKEHQNLVKKIKEKHPNYFDVRPYTKKEAVWVESTGDEFEDILNKTTKKKKVSSASKTVSKNISKKVSPSIGKIATLGGLATLSLLGTAGLVRKKMKDKKKKRDESRVKTYTRKGKLVKSHIRKYE